MIVEPLPMKKNEFVACYLRGLYCHMIDCITKENSIHVFCNGSVGEYGRAGCGVVMWKYNGCEEKCESTAALRLLMVLHPPRLNCMVFVLLFV